MATLRADFYARCVEDAALAALLEAGTFPLSVPRQAALYEMITRPAERAGLAFEEGLAARILEDTGDDPGALALLAYALDQLYRRGADDGKLAFAEYRLIGGVQGAIGERAEAAFGRLTVDAQGAFGTIFRELVEVDERGEPTRRRAALEPLSAEAGARALIDGLTNERLLVTSRGEGGAVVEVAHEALLRSWDRLRLWIDAQARDLQLRRRLEGEARAWAIADLSHKADFLLLGSRLEEAEQWISRFPAAPEVHDFILASAAYRAEQVSYEARRKEELRAAAIQAGQAQQAAQVAQEQAERRRQEARASTEQAERQRRRARTAIIAALFLILVAGGAGVFALDQTRAAEAARQQAEAARQQAEDAQAQVETQVAALNAIVPGATQGAQWSRWASISDNVFRIAELGTTDVASNDQWVPVELEINGVTMVLVPAGCFMMGSEDVREQPVHEQCFDAPFWIDRTEVTQADFERLGGEKSRANRFDGDRRPVERITWFEARDFCELRGARLPTEREWEYAARGPDSLGYPWGNDWDFDNAVWDRGDDEGTAEVGSILAGVSWVGALDMSGNVWEWTSSQHEAYPYDASDGREDDTEGRSDVQRVLRGGSWDYSYAGFLRAAYRYWVGPDGGGNFGGFRCARSA